jgi:hypothetical protein
MKRELGSFDRDDSWSGVSSTSFAGFTFHSTEHSLSTLSAFRELSL